MSGWGPSHCQERNDKSRAAQINVQHLDESMWLSQQEPAAWESDRLDIARLTHLLTNLSKAVVNRMEAMILWPDHRACTSLIDLDELGFSASKWHCHALQLHDRRSLQACLLTMHLMHIVLFKEHSARTPNDALAMAELLGNLTSPTPTQSLHCYEGCISLWPARQTSSHTAATLHSSELHTQSHTIYKTLTVQTS